MRERYDERGPPLALLLTFVLVAGGLNLAVGGLMQVVVTHGGGGALPSVAASTRIELIDGQEVEPTPEGDEEAPIPEALISLEEPMRETVPEDAEYTDEFNRAVDEEMRGQRGADPGAARGRQNQVAQRPESMPEGTRPTQGREARPDRPAAQGQGGAVAAETPSQSSPKPPAAPEDADGAQPMREEAGGSQTPAPKTPPAAQPGQPQSPVQAQAPAPTLMAPDPKSMRESMHEVFGGGGSHEAIEAPADGPRDQVNTIQHDFAGFFNRIREQIVTEWDPNEAIEDESDTTREAIHRRTRLTLLRIRLRKDGSVDRIWITRTSGFDILDEHAVRAVRAAAPFANLPPGLQGKSDGKLVFSMEFRFTRSGKDVLRMRP